MQLNYLSYRKKYRTPLVRPLIGFGMLIFILKDLFAFLAAAVFFIAGFSAIGYAIRLFWSSRKSHDDEAVRKNVTIHREDF